VKQWGIAFTIAFACLMLLRAECYQVGHRWRFIGGAWKATDGELIGESMGGHAFAIAQFSRYSRTQTVEVTMNPISRVGDGWVAGGICIYQDGGNFWRLALVEAPDGKMKYAELVAMSGGVWQAQAEMKLKVISEHEPSFSWSWGERYRLRIVLTENAIDGQVLSTDGKLLWRRCYSLDGVVRSGWMALNVQGMRASFVEATQKIEGGEALVLNLRKASVVRDSAMGNLRLSEWLADSLKKLNISVSYVSLDELSNSNWWRKLDSGLLVLPNGRRMPAVAKEGLLEFLRCGGKLIVFGVPLFEEALFRVDGTWMTASEIEARRERTKPQRFLFERLSEDELKLWQHGSSHPDVSDRLSIERSALRVDGLEVDALRIDLELKGWGIFSRSFGASPFGEDHSLTCFWAKGAPQTKSMLVEWREADGSRWYAHVPLSTDWKLIVLSPLDFTYRADSPTGKKRGYAGDSLNVKNARTLVIGMEGPMPLGKHTILVAGLGTAKDPLGGFKADFSSPTLEALCPAYKFYRLKDLSEIRIADVQPIGRQKQSSLKLRPQIDYAVVPTPRHKGIGFVGERPFRIVPLTEPPIMWLMLNAELPYAFSWWLCFGSADEKLFLQNDAFGNLLLKTLGKLINGAMLVEAGCDKFTAYAGEDILLGARVINLSDTQVEALVSFSVTPKDRKGIRESFTYSKELKLAPQSIEAITHKLPKLPTGKYSVSVTLAKVVKGVTAPCDAIESELVVVEPPKVTDADRVKVKGAHFHYRGKRWFAFGLNYWPRFIAGQEPVDYGRHWLDPVNYDPEVIEADLRLLKEMGMNCVSISYGDVRQAMPLRDFLRRCYEHDIKVNLFIAGAHPLHFQPEIVRQLLEAADLPNQPALFAYDIAWEPRWGGYNERRRYDNEWRKWLEENYGSIEAAEKDFGFKLPRDEKGNVTVPKDEHLLKDGEWRIMAAAYRRFLDDMLSRRYRAVVRFIRSLDPNHLIGARTGYGGGPFGAEGAFPFDHTSGAKHLDFISPEGWNLGWLGQAEEEQFARAVFITAYGRWAGNSKPVFWAEFGLTLRHGPFSLDWYDDEERLQAQAKLYDAIYRLMQLSDADGAMGWWFPGGYRVNERSDFGIVNPDGTLRPAAHIAKKWAKVLTNLPEVDKRQTAFIVIDRDENARGPMALWLKHGEEVSRLVREGKRIELRTEGTGKTSDDVPRLSIGNTKWEPMKPPKFINGEINAVYISHNGRDWREVRDGESIKLEGDWQSATTLHMKVELGNTGEATWLPQNRCKDPLNGIAVMVKVNDEALTFPIPKVVERFGDVLVEGIALRMPRGDAHITVNMLWRNSPFGERVSFELRR